MNYLNSDCSDIYCFLDKETEMLTDYVNKINDVFKDIINREKLKVKIQAKANKSNKLIYYCILIFIRSISREFKKVVNSYY